MAKHDVRQTRGSFRLKGKVTGVKREDFFKNKLTKTNKDMNFISFGIKTSEENTSYVRLQGMTNDKAYFNKYDKEEKKNVVKTISWDDRFNFNEEGFNPQFGLRYGIERDEDGELTDKGIYFPYDACLELKEKLKDDMSVFVQGQIEISSFVTKNKDGDEVKVSSKQFKPTAIYSSKQEIDFEAEDFEEENIFKQEIIFMNIEKSPDEDGKYLVQAKVVTYDSVEDVEFVIRNIKLANQFKKNLKPYNMIEVMGRLISRISVEEDKVEEDTWGEDDIDEKFNRVNAPRIQEMLITQAKPSTIDKETYSEEILESITKAEEDFGEDADVEWDSDDEEIEWN